ncbi:Helix-turn-helix domain protein [Phycisphaerae bacterium RAS1]|nr:Helix-turn-helix domain protein [Phycisphaerae bacterium RAS1]
MVSTRQFLTTAELAERLRVSPETIREWARRGDIPSVRLSRKAIRYDADAVLAALSSRAGKGAADAR